MSPVGYAPEGDPGCEPGMPLPGYMSMVGWTIGGSTFGITFPLYCKCNARHEKMCAQKASSQKERFFRVNFNQMYRPPDHFRAGSGTGRERAKRDVVLE